MTHIPAIVFGWKIGDRIDDQTIHVANIYIEPRYREKGTLYIEYKPNKGARP
jgi:hypothetical protein